MAYRVDRVVDETSTFSLSLSLSLSSELTHEWSLISIASLWNSRQGYALPLQDLYDRVVVGICATSRAQLPQASRSTIDL